MSDLIPTGDRIMALLSPPSQDVHLTVDDARWIKAEIERLEAVVDAARSLFVRGLHHTADLDDIQIALAALENDDE